eukprot:scaffold155_cov347-Pavlova_lutheri.AAC.1
MDARSRSAWTLRKRFERLEEEFSRQEGQGRDGNGWESTAQQLPATPQVHKEARRQDGMSEIDRPGESGSRSGGKTRVDREQGKGTDWIKNKENLAHFKGADESHRVGEPDDAETDKLGTERNERKTKKQVQALDNREEYLKKLAEQLFEKEAKIKHEEHISALRAAAMEEEEKQIRKMRQETELFLQESEAKVKQENFEATLQLDEIQCKSKQAEEGLQNLRNEEESLRASLNTLLVHKAELDRSIAMAEEQKHQACREAEFSESAAREAVEEETRKIEEARGKTQKAQELLAALTEELHMLQRQRDAERNQLEAEIKEGRQRTAQQEQDAAEAASRIERRLEELKDRDSFLQQIDEIVKYNEALVFVRSERVQEAACHGKNHIDSQLAHQLCPLDSFLKDWKQKVSSPYIAREQQLQLLEQQAKSKLQLLDEKENRLKSLEEDLFDKEANLNQRTLQHDNKCQEFYNYVNGEKEALQLAQGALEIEQNRVEQEDIRIREIEADQRIVREQIDSDNQALQNLKAELHKKEANLERDNHKLQMNIKEMNKQRQANEEEILAKQEMLQNQYDQIQKALQERENKLAQQEKLVSTTEASLQEKASFLRQQELDLASLEASLNEDRDSLEASQRALKDAQAHLSTKQAELEEIQAEANQSAAQLEERHQDIEKAARELEERQTILAKEADEAKVRMEQAESALQEREER